MEEAFTYVYEQGVWGNNNITEYNGSSGLGSDIDYNIDTYIPFLKKFITDNNIKSIVDLGCGDFRCGKLIYDELDVVYTGYDVYKKVIDYNSTQHELTKYSFIHLDFCNKKESIINGELCILKDVLQHWSLNNIYKFLDYLIENKKFKYILIGNCCNQNADNTDTNDGNWMQLSCDYLPLKKYNPIKLFNYHTKEISVITSEQNIYTPESNVISNELQFGEQYYLALQYHMEEALIEANLNPNDAVWDPKIALFSKKYYNEINELNHNKIYDFCFIGSINSSDDRRKWVIDFAKKYFTSNSIFINTDVKYDTNSNWELLGSYDYSHMGLGYCPKHVPDHQSRIVQYRVVKENLDYFEKMCQSKFVLCPGGDAPWSFRYYETLMCKSVPIVESWHHTYRTKEESDIKYKYVLYQNIQDDIIYEDYVNDNISIFEKYHMLN